MAWKAAAVNFIKHLYTLAQVHHDVNPTEQESRMFHALLADRIGADGEVEVEK